MNHRIALSLVVLAALAAGGAVFNRLSYIAASSEGEPGVVAGGDKAVPVLVELFTSEGCSSCPPADQVLMQLEESQPVAGAEVIALSEHVDYWNRLGWADPFSSAAFSERQGRYARAFGNDDIYTPQMVVDGQFEFVGSNMSRARDAIKQAARSPKAEVRLAIDSSKSAGQDAAISLGVSVSNLPRTGAGEDMEVLLAITESGLQSSVSRGENAGRKLGHTAVVRKLTVIGEVSSQEGGTFTAAPSVMIEKGWNRERLRAVVFVQQRASRRVGGAASISLAGRPQVRQD